MVQANAVRGQTQWDYRNSACSRSMLQTLKGVFCRYTHRSRGVLPSIPGESTFYNSK